MLCGFTMRKYVTTCALLSYLALVPALQPSASCVRWTSRSHAHRRSRVRRYTTEYSDTPDVDRRRRPLRRFLKSRLPKGIFNKEPKNEEMDRVISTKTAPDKPSSLPTYSKLLIFTTTTILIWISEPLLSLVDTTIVGMTSSAKSAVVQIAALGPATTLYDTAIYMTYFLAMATTNQLAPALAKKDWKTLRESTSHLMGLALFFGALVSVFTFGFGLQVISNIVGPMTNSEIIPLATKYAWIRAAVAPFSVVDFVAQSFCLATLDVKTPALAVAVASLVNIVGDLTLAPMWGIQGAAVATAMATVSSCLILVNKVRKTTKEWKEKQLSMEGISKPLTRVVNGTIEIVPSIPTEGATDSTRTESAQKSKERDISFFSLPNRAALIDLFKLAGPIFFVMLAKCACYSIMTVRATSFGIVHLATHNIMMRVFFFFTCFGDSLSQATQTFYPQVSKRKQGKLVKRLFYLSTVIGLGISQLSSGILKNFGSFLTKDSTIIALMAKYAPYVGYATMVHPFLMFLEGLILAKRDLLFMVGMYIVTTSLHFAFVFSPISNSFSGLWRALFVFQGLRLIQPVARILNQPKESSKEEL